MCRTHSKHIRCTLNLTNLPLNFLSFLSFSLVTLCTTRRIWDENKFIILTCIWCVCHICNVLVVTYYENKFIILACIWCACHMCNALVVMYYMKKFTSTILIHCVNTISSKIWDEIETKKILKTKLKPDININNKKDSFT